MVFNSLEFLYFFAVVYTLYCLSPFRIQNLLLLVAGYVFYGMWDVRFLYLIAFSTAVDFNIGLMLGTGEIPPKQRGVSSLFLILSAFLFLCFPWREIRESLLSESAVQGLPRLLSFEPLGLWVLAGTLVFVVGANLLYFPLARMEPRSRDRILVFLTVFVNLTFLGVFKYFNFFIDSAAAVLRTMGASPEFLRLHIILPVGISFYTFQSLSYTLDAYRKVYRPTSRFWEFALFVAYFPPMVAGPIERARHLLPQLQHPRKIRYEGVIFGLTMILQGLFKKVGIADTIAPAVAAVYGTNAPVGAFDVIAGTLLFTIQIFCDFSGYSDIAIGVSKLLGIDLLRNFNVPYLSQNPSEFWRRWHISLSSWLRDYLYISLGGNRKGERRTYFNLMATMVLGGLWHGAAWTYVAWGFYQGLLLCVHRAFTVLTAKQPAKSLASAPVSRREGSGDVTKGWLSRVMPSLWLVANVAFFFVFVCYGWLLFRAESFAQIVLFTKTAIGFGPHGIPSVIPRTILPAFPGIALLALLQVAEYRDGRSEYLLHLRPILQGLVYAIMIVAVIMGLSNEPVQFIYFQF